MSEIFLGKAAHWLLLVVISAILWVVGEYHVHVSQFHYFVFIVLALSVVCLSIVVLGHKKGDRIMREPLEEPKDQA
jgi:hypothetical protein